MRNWALGVCIALLASCEQQPEFAPDPAPMGEALRSGDPAGVDHPITQSEYDRLTIGMSRDQVRAIVGEGCTPSAQTGALQTLVCVNSSGASAVLTFENEALVTRSSTGDLDATEPPPP